uniref:Uncharacterized protein n=1 Tax=Physcomitrium patens TaxID=3218 RepID=A0A2K1IM09_PHYPA|nr:hypothetical protein PHYPA_026624 [Physcomitrium patens]
MYSAQFKSSSLDNDAFWIEPLFTASITHASSVFSHCLARRRSFALACGDDHSPSKSMKPQQENVWNQLDSCRAVTVLMIKAYTVSVLLVASVLLWFAGDLATDTCFYYGYFYLDSRYSRRINYTFVDFG